jgi:hypothetical protein
LTAWRASVRRVDVLVASVLAALALGLGAYLLLRAEAAAHLAFTERAQRLQAAVTDKLILPQENLTALAAFSRPRNGIAAQFRVVRSNARPSASSCTRSVAASRPRLERAGFRRSALRRTAGLPLWELGPDEKPREAGRRDTYVPVYYMEPPSVLALGFDIAANPAPLGDRREGARLGGIAASPPRSS